MDKTKDYTTFEKTLEFMETMLVPGNGWVADIASWGKFKRKLAQVDKRIIKEEIQNTPYTEFLKTAYWRIIAAKVKKSAKSRCQLCGSPQRLAVHHRSYANHGDEAHHLEDLVCLCKSCHSKFHDKVDKEG